MHRTRNKHPPSTKQTLSVDGWADGEQPVCKNHRINSSGLTLGRTERYVKETISPEIYASKEVRTDSTEKYFNDLAQDEFSRDLLKFKDVLRSATGEPYRYKSLSEAQFDDLINLVFSKNDDSPVVKSADDLVSLIVANGIISKKDTTIGKFYRFAPIYHYAWGLANGELESEEKKRKKEEKTKPVQPEENKLYEGEITSKGGGLFAVTPTLPHRDFLIKRPPFGCIEGDRITFYLETEPSKKGMGLFWFAVDVEQVE